MAPHLDPRDLFDIPDPFADDRDADPKPLDVTALPPAPTRSRIRALRWSAIATVIALNAGFIMVRGVRRGSPLGVDVLGMGVVLPLLAAVIVFAVLRRCSSRKSSIQAAMVVGAAVFLSTTALSRSTGVESPHRLLCAYEESILAAASFVCLASSMRHAFVAAVRERTAALGLATGLAAAAVIRIHCSDDTFLHVLLGHGLPILIAMLVAAAWGSRLIRA